MMTTSTTYGVYDVYDVVEACDTMCARNLADQEEETGIPVDAAVLYGVVNLLHFSSNNIIIVVYIVAPGIQPHP